MFFVAEEGRKEEARRGEEGKESEEQRGGKIALKGRSTEKDKQKKSKAAGPQVIALCRGCCSSVDRHIDRWFDNASQASKDKRKEKQERKDKTEEVKRCRPTSYSIVPRVLLLSRQTHTQVDR